MQKSDLIFTIISLVQLCDFLKNLQKCFVNNRDEAFLQVFLSTGNFIYDARANNLYCFDIIWFKMKKTYDIRVSYSR